MLKRWDRLSPKGWATLSHTEVEQHLKFAGYAKDAKVSELVHKVVEHENATRGDVLSAGLAGAVEQARRARMAAGGRKRRSAQHAEGHKPTML